MSSLLRLMLFLLLLPGASVAAHQLPLPPRPLPPPQVWIPPQQGLEPIVLDEISIAIRMQGFLAHTRIDLTFANPNARVLEGEFVFPLGPGQTVSGYALEVDGAMREGVVVPKQTARVAFEDITRQQVDPGLAELTAGNVFRTRLYPIPARGKKRVSLQFEQLLDDAGTHWRYVLPLYFRTPVRKFSVQAEAPLDAPAPELVSDSPDAGLRFEQAASVWRSGFTRENVTPQRELAFRVPKQADQSHVMEAQDRLEPARRAVLALIDSARPDELPAPPDPSRIALFFDASGSANERDLARERAVLAAWIARLGTVQVDLIVFRDRAEAVRRIMLKSGDARPLLDVLEALALDGASNYGAIDFAAVAKADLALVIGDGRDTWGRGRIDFSQAPKRLHVLHAAQRHDPVRLSEIARHGGTEVIDLSRMDTEQAVAAFSAPRWQWLSTRVEGDCSELAPAAPQPLSAHLHLAAHCTGKGVLTLSFGTPDGRHRVERRIEFGQQAPVEGALADAVWRAFAARRIEQMQAAASPDVEAITRLAMQHGVVTAQTSLLVLDRIEDYVRYGIEPKEEALRQQYLDYSKNHPKPGPEAGKQERLQALAKRWNAFRQWHQQRHPWLETLLLPAAEAEAGLWQGLAASPRLQEKALTAARQELESIIRQSRALVERWPEDGADPARRTIWEREASALMLRLDALREQRLEQAPESAQWRSGEAPTAVSANSEGAVPPQPVIEHASEALSAPAPVAAERQRSAPSAAARLDSVEPTEADSPGLPLQARVTLSGWNPDTPYLKALRTSKTPYQTYLGLRKEHAHTPSFFLDVADFFQQQQKDAALALRILSNLAEIGDENTALLRVLAHRLMQWQMPKLALRPFQEALAQRPEEPQSHRDLALALAGLPQPQIDGAIARLWHIATHDWHERFPGIELIALHELTALLAAHPGVDIAALGIPPEFLAPVPVSLRVVLTWDADNTDIDLWVTDPAGEVVYYGQPRSRSGGEVSRDFTRGYGPEVFSIARPLPGTYRVQAHYYGDRRQSLTGPVTLQLEFQTGFGGAQPVRKAVTRRLETGKQLIDVGQFRITP